MCHHVRGRGHSGRDRQGRRHRRASGRANERAYLGRSRETFLSYLCNANISIVSEASF